MKVKGRFKKQVLAKCLLLLVIVAAGGIGVHRYMSPGNSEPGAAPNNLQSKDKPALEQERKVKQPKSVLRSQLAGQWYSADANELRSQIAGFFEKAKAEPVKDVIGLILPHAGYRYSGQIAVIGLKKTDKKYKRIIVIGPTHSLPMEELLSVPRATHYETPLGQIPIDVQFVNKLLKFPLFQNIPRAHQGEHSVQIELPLLQYQQKDFKLVPIVAGSCSLETITRAGAVLRGLVDEDTLIVASSDFVHYGPRFPYVPFTENIPEQIEKLDMGAYKQIARLDVKGFLEYKKTTGATICGYIPIAILISTLEDSATVQLAKYATSGELTGDFNNSVSYLSIVFTGKWKNNPEIKPPDNSCELTEEDKRELLALARKTIDYALEKRRVPQASELGVKISDAMKSPRAAFVTLNKNGRLRGCIGDIFPQRPLYRSVIMNAINACFNDRRFPQVTKAECRDIEIEISALTIPAPIASYEQFRVGTDGIVLSKDGRSAVFLPQVAPEKGWDVNQTLSQLSRKAGLPEDAWKQGASFLVFQADVFGEEK